MIINILTLFPNAFHGPLTESILFSAQKKGLVKINIIDLHDFATDKHRSCDDSPYGGGAGMVLRVDIIDRALSSCHSEVALATEESSVSVLLTPRGKTYNQSTARKYSKLDEITLICGHYEGVDERVTKLVDEQISIGDYVLTGGEIAAMAVVDSVVRLVPGVIKKESLENESFKTEKYIEHAQYTRPEIYKKMEVPKILLSGNHKEIKKWRESH